MGAFGRMRWQMQWNRPGELMGNYTLRRRHERSAETEGMLKMSADGNSLTTDHDDIIYICVCNGLQAEWVRISYETDKCLDQIDHTARPVCLFEHTHSHTFAFLVLPIWFCPGPSTLWEEAHIQCDVLLQQRLCTREVDFPNNPAPQSIFTAEARTPIEH